MSERILLSDEQKDAIARLEKCSFLPGSFEKRFVRDVFSQREQGLTAKQYEFLKRVLFRYRKQMHGKQTKDLPVRNWIDSVFPSQSVEGFTLPEVLTALVIVGLLSALAFPSYLNQRRKAQEGEALLHVGQIARDQQAYYAEHSRFAALADLDTHPDDSANFRYEVRLSGNGETETAETRAVPLTGLRGAIALNWVYRVGESGGLVAGMLRCQGAIGQTGAVRADEEAGYVCADGSGAVPIVE